MYLVSALRSSGTGAVVDAELVRQLATSRAAESLASAAAAELFVSVERAGARTGP